MSDINWDEAPEYYDFHLENKLDKSSEGFCHLLNGKYIFLDGSVSSHDEAWNITKRPPKPTNFSAIPDDKPTYTQAMKDAGELPSVGMEVLFEGVTVVIVGLSTVGYPIFEYKNGMVDSFNRKSTYTPLDTRTDSQKCDDLFKIYLKGEQVSTHKSFSQAVKDGDFGDNIKWSK